jgi:hypothetical protein
VNQLRPGASREYRTGVVAMQNTGCRMWSYIALRYSSCVETNRAQPPQLF